MERADRETWAKRVGRWKDSGPSAAEFATEIGVTPKALSWWKWQLGTGEKRKPARRSKPRKVALSPMTFVEMSARVVRRARDHPCERRSDPRARAGRLRRARAGARRSGKVPMIPASVRIFVCTERQDMRRSFDALALAV